MDESEKTITLVLSQNEAELVSQVLGHAQLNADMSLVRATAMNKVAVEYHKVFPPVEEKKEEEKVK